MNPEEKAALKHIEEVSEENNRMIRRMYHSVRFGQFVSVVKWAIIIGFAIGAFYYLQPIFDKIDQIYSTLTNSHLPSFQDFIDKFK